MAITFKYQAGSNYTWGTDTFITQYENIKNGAGSTDFYNPVEYIFQFETDTELQIIRPCRTVSGNYLSIFGAYSGYSYFTLSGNLPWDTYADRWMTAIVSFSSDGTDFVNWTGTTGGALWYQRIVLQDARTGELLSQTDVRYNPFTNKPTDWANYTWSWATGPGGASDLANVVAQQIGAGGQFAVDDFLTTASWICMGDVVDPMATVNGVELRQYFVGQCFPETVNGARAWFNWTAFDTTVVSTTTQATKVLESRATQTDDYIFGALTSNLTTPITDASIP
jgi:hypothetical protein